VSRILSNDPTLAVSDETRSRVWKVARDSGYLAKKKRAQGKKKRRLVRVGIVIAPPIQLQQASYYALLMRSLQTALADEGHQVASVLSHTDIADPGLLYTQLTAETVDGAIVLGAPPDSLVQWVDSQQMSLVLVTSSGYVEDTHDRVAVNHHRSAAKAVRHLVARGCRRVAYLGPVVNTLRYEGYVQTMATANLPIFPELVWESSWDIESALTSAERGLAKVGSAIPDGLFAASDTLAIGAIRILQQAGYDVPGDVRVVGHDDQPLMAFISPSLTTVRVPVEDMGKVAVRMLLERLSGTRNFPVHTFLPTSLVVRESSGAEPS
jgi:LacI family transcriptional regulator